jgi:Family of unknown function (DUF5652)
MNAYFWSNVLVYVLFIWSIFCKGIALWRSAELKQRNWFIIFVILNAIVLGFLELGILELIYLFKFAKKPLTFEEIKSWKKIFVTHAPEKKK